MLKLRLSTKFLLSMLLISAGLTAASLLFVRRTMQAQVRSEIFADLRNSVLTFQNVQREREATLSRSAELIADLPIVRALMTTHDAVTIQDASRSVWQLAGSDLFVLVDRTGKVFALHTSSPGFSANSAQQLFSQEIEKKSGNHWCFGGGHLYEVFFRPVYFGASSEDRLLGYLAVGYEINDQVAHEAARVASSKVAFWYGGTVARSTLSPAQEAQLQRRGLDAAMPSQPQTRQVQLGSERFLATSLDLSPGTTPAVRLNVLKSYDEATAFLKQLNRSLLALGLVAVLIGSLLVFAISHTFTRPLSALVLGVRALEKGDFDYPLEARGQDEVAEVTTAFHRTRETLRSTQRRLLESERLATIGQMATSISHDLRHSLAAVVANAEFLSESRLDSHQREELYHEVRIAVDQMTEMLESLLEFSRTSESLRRSYGNLQEPLERAIQTARANPEFAGANINMRCEGQCEGWFDFRRLQRAFQNLVINALEATPKGTANLDIVMRRMGRNVEIRIQDNGPGIPEDIRERLFQPFVSSGKQYGTGLGLTVVKKILQDHGGAVRVETTSERGTTFVILLPVIVGEQSEIATLEAGAQAAPLTHTQI